MTRRWPNPARILRGAVFIVAVIGVPVASLFLPNVPATPLGAAAVVIWGIFLAYVLPVTYFGKLLSLIPRATGRFGGWLDEIFHSGIEVFAGSVACLAVGYAIVFRTMGLIDAKTLVVTHDPSTALYFSTTTMTTLGFGDFKPVQMGRFFAGAEAISGLIVLALAFVIFRRLSGGMFDAAPRKG